jgi:serine/threonine protein kinase
MHKLNLCELQHGSPHRRQGILMDMGDQTMCLTNSQFATLFGKRRSMPKQIGCGAFGCAYQAPEKNKVVKLTSDPTDVWSMRYAQGTGAVPTLYRTFKLHSSDANYAMVLEKLRPMRHTKRGRKLMRPWMCVRNKLRDSVKECCAPGSYNEQFDRRQDPRPGTGRRGLPPAKCRRDIMGILQAKRELAARGIIVTDDHSGNIGYDRKGNWKIIDMGLTEGDPSADVRQLQGARRRR